MLTDLPCDALYYPNFLLLTPESCSLNLQSHIEISLMVLAYNTEPTRVSFFRNLHIWLELPSTYVPTSVPNDTLSVHSSNTGRLTLEVAASVTCYLQRSLDGSTGENIIIHNLLQMAVEFSGCVQKQTEAAFDGTSSSYGDIQENITWTASFTRIGISR